jgi:hypothetical protein
MRSLSHHMTLLTRYVLPVWSKSIYSFGCSCAHPYRLEDYCWTGFSLKYHQHPFWLHASLAPLYLTITVHCYFFGCFKFTSITFIQGLVKICENFGF